MPFKSKAQQRWMFAAESRGELPKGTAKDWAHHTPNIKKLPERIGDDTKEGSDHMNAITLLATHAADDAMVEKLASDTQITPELVRHLADKVNMTPSAFVKLAYSNPTQYVEFLKVTSGAAKLTPDMVKKAAGGTGLLSTVLQRMRSGAGKVGEAYKAARGQESKLKGAYAGPSEIMPKGETATAVDKALGGVNGNAFDRLMGRGPLGGSRLGRNVQAAGGAAGVGLGGAGVASQMGGGKQPPAAGPQESAVNTQIGGAAAANQPGVAPAQTNGPAANPAAQGGAGGGLGTPGKALLAAGGLGLGAMGAGALMRRKKKKEVTAKDLALDVMRYAAEKKAAELFRKEAADTLCRYLDTVAGKMSLEKAACVRTLQAAVSQGRPLSHAIKMAYPHLNGEQRGILATKLVKAAAHSKRAGDKPFFKGKVTGREEADVKMSNGAVKKMKQMSGCS